MREGNQLRGHARPGEVRSAPPPTPKEAASTYLLFLSDNCEFVPIFNLEASILKKNGEIQRNQPFSPGQREVTIKGSGFEFTKDVNLRFLLHAQGLAQKV